MEFGFWGLSQSKTILPKWVGWLMMATYFPTL
jgi:hypothetical protein